VVLIRTQHHEKNPQPMEVAMGFDLFRTVHPLLSKEKMQ
jgi:hypothetical protein